MFVILRILGLILVLVGMKIGGIQGGESLTDESFEVVDHVLNGAMQRRARISK